MSKYSPWFPPEVKPVRVGVYEVRNGGNFRWFRKWDGYWFIGDNRLDTASRERERLSWETVCEWRGLSKPTGGK
jgi:hypothetical protein